MCARQHTPPLAYGSNLKCTRRTLSGVLAKPYGRPERYWGKVESASTSTFYEDAHVQEPKRSLPSPVMFPILSPTRSAIAKNDQ